MSNGTTARLAPLPGPGAQIRDLLWQDTTWEHRTMLTERQDIDRTHGVPRGRCATLLATVYPAVSAPLPAYGTRLRGKGFAEGDHPSRLVVQLLDELARAGRADLLRLHAPDALNGSPT